MCIFRSIIQRNAATVAAQPSPSLPVVTLDDVISGIDVVDEITPRRRKITRNVDVDATLATLEIDAHKLASQYRNCDDDESVKTLIADAEGKL